MNLSAHTSLCTCPAGLEVMSLILVPERFINLINLPERFIHYCSTIIVKECQFLFRNLPSNCKALYWDQDNMHKNTLQIVIKFVFIIKELFP